MLVCILTNIGGFWGKSTGRICSFIDDSVHSWLVLHKGRTNSSLVDDGWAIPGDRQKAPQQEDALELLI